MRFIVIVMLGWRNVLARVKIGKGQHISINYIFSRRRGKCKMDDSEEEMVGGEGWKKVARNEKAFV